jgi:hypothetical protein
MASGSTGNGSVVLGDRPDWSLDLHATTLNLDSLLAPLAGDRQQRQPAGPEPDATAASGDRRQR